ncbi:MAG: ribonuclease H-like domain-containing protein [Armatimonadetes bacterium]|nr:ribonuclease H-like domain-containing protein [Armatimonadota bacterium]
MLRQTFFHIPGIGRTTERLLWEHGCHDWETLLSRLDSVPMPETAKALAPAILEHSIRAVECQEHQFFAKPLGLNEAWRAWPEFRERCVYLDIETDGGFEGDSVTMVGLYDKDGFRALVRDVDLHLFPDIITHYSMIVTFFGSGFDLPMLQKRFWGMEFDQIHLDLCPTFKRVGVRGGLKKIERALGIARGEETDGLTGLDAIKLWREYQEGSAKALQVLVDYNREDVVNLEKLAGIAYRMLRDVTVPFAMRT